jgi:hypothetical protein
MTEQLQQLEQEEYMTHEYNDNPNEHTGGQSEKTGKQKGYNGRAMQSVNIGRLTTGELVFGDNAVVTETEDGASVAWGPDVDGNPRSNVRIGSIEAGNPGNPDADWEWADDDDWKTPEGGTGITGQNISFGPDGIIVDGRRLQDGEF